MATLCVSSTKGGVGKTTIAIGIGAELALDGYRVALLDCDLNQHATHFGKIAEGGVEERTVRRAHSMRQLLGTDADPGSQRQHGTTGKDELPNEIAVRELQGDGNRDRAVEDPNGDALHIGAHFIPAAADVYARSVQAELAINSTE